MLRPWMAAALAVLAAACSQQSVVERQLSPKNVQENLAAFRDGLRLEHMGVEGVNLIQGAQPTYLSLPEYLFEIGRKFEELGRPQEALQTYFHLLLKYALASGRTPLGLSVENRIRWQLADKSWLLSTPEALVVRLTEAIRTRDETALADLMSRDFGLGTDERNRYPVPFEAALHMLQGALRTAITDEPEVEVLGRKERGILVLKASGLSEGRKTWYFALHESKHPAGWEWHMAYWRRQETRAEDSRLRLQVREQLLPDSR